MYYMIGVFIFSLFASYLILPNVLLISHKKKLFDIPDVRKTHKNPVPRLGGVSFFPVILLVMLGCVLFCSLEGNSGFMMQSDMARTQFCAFCIGGITLFLVGVKDDLVGVGYKAKFAAQIFAGSLLSFSGLWIDSLGEAFFLDCIPPYIGIPMSVFLCVYITNGINLIDGIDGLASGLSIISLTTMGILFYMSDEMAYAILALSGVGCLIPFFWVNVRRSPGSRKKLFMGDTGSLTLGHLISFLFLNLCINTPTFQPLELRYQYIVFGTLIIPLFDIVRVVLLRLRLGNPPFLPDRNHIHHKLLRTGMSDTQVMVSLLLLSIFFIICNYILTGYLYGGVVFVIDVLIWFLFHGILDIFIKKKALTKLTSSECLQFEQ